MHLLCNRKLWEKYCFGHWLSNFMLILTRIQHVSYRHMLFFTLLFFVVLLRVYLWKTACGISFLMYKSDSKSEFNSIRMSDRIWILSRSYIWIDRFIVQVTFIHQSLARVSFNSECLQWYPLRETLSWSLDDCGIDYSIYTVPWTGNFDYFDSFIGL